MPSENFSVETLQPRKEQEERFQSTPAVSKEYFSQQSYPSEMKMLEKQFITTRPALYEMLK